jgi:hypothetical protein
MRGMGKMRRRRARKRRTAMRWSEEETVGEIPVRGRANGSKRREVMSGAST